MDNRQRIRLGDYVTEVEFVDADLLQVLEHRPSTNVLTVIDKGALPHFPQAPQGIVLDGGEPSKQWSTVAHLLEQAMEQSLGRDGLVIAVGGGAICDLTAFFAAIYMRGLRLWLVPTTLLGMVDAALGGKSGINWGGYKNMVGAFYPAERIYIVTSALTSLSEREYRSGLAEIIKCALLGDEDLLGLLRLRQEAVLQCESSVLREMITRSLRVKGDIVSADFREDGQRAWLNLGHTFGHALEAATELSRWTHGEAVCWGIVQALRLGLRLGITEKAYVETVIGCIESYQFPTKIGDLDVDALLAAMEHDKKRVGGQLRLVLQRRLGETLLQTVERSDVVAILKENRG